MFYTLLCVIYVPFKIVMPFTVLQCVSKDIIYYITICCTIAYYTHSTMVRVLLCNVSLFKHSFLQSEDLRR